MEYKLKFHPRAATDLYKPTKKDKQLGKRLVNSHIPQILADPYSAGKRKKGDLASVYGYNLTYKGMAHRILYEVEGQDVRIIAIGLHDVAYRKSKKRR